MMGAEAGGFRALFLAPHGRWNCHPSVEMDGKGAFPSVSIGAKVP